MRHKARDRPATSDSTPLWCAPISEGAKCFNDALDKLHKLMKRWDEFPRLRAGLAGEGELDFSGATGISDHSRVHCSIIVPHLDKS
jgi:hypothetical protein